jgi:hypothetical protein
MKTLFTISEFWMRTAAVSGETLDTVLCQLLLHRVCTEKNTPQFFQFRFRNMNPWYSFNMKNQFTQIHPLGSAWCLLQTQYAKKPKNPV